MKINNANDTITGTGGAVATLPGTTGALAVKSEIPNFPMGELEYFSMTGTVITISGTSDGSTNMVKVAPTTTGDFHTETDNGGANDGRLRYTGTATKMFHCAVTLSGTPANPNDVFVFGIAHNGTVDCKTLGSASGTQASALHCMVMLATNDYIEFYIGNTTASRNFTVKTLNIFMMGV